MRQRSAIALLILAIIVVGLLLYQTPLMRGARAYTWQLLVAKTAAVFHVGQISVRPDVMEQLQQLRAENTRLHYELSDYARIKRQIGSASFDSFTSIPSAVLGRPIDTFQTEYTLAKGAADGVGMDEPVVIDNSILIGFISDVYTHTSTVRLLIHPKTSLTAEVMAGEDAATPARGLLIGQQYTSVILTTIPRDVLIKKGQPIVTVANDQIPAGLTIGAVGKISNKENEPYQQTEVELPYDPDTIDAVTILAHP